MLIVALIEGIRIEVYFDDHPPPHFHVRAAEHRFQMKIADQVLIAGNAPAPVVRKIRVWARRHRAELQAAWDAASRGDMPKRIT